MRRSPLLMLLLMMAACGDADGVDREDPDVVARGVVRALARADFDAMQQLMSPDCYRALQSDLTLFQTDLARPETPRGRQVHRIGREQLGADWDAAVATARAGSFKAAWRLFIRIRPIPDPPEILGSRTAPDDPDLLYLMYRRAGTTQQQIRLRRRGGIWVVEHVAI